MPKVVITARLPDGAVPWPQVMAGCDLVGPAAGAWPRPRWLSELADADGLVALLVDRIDADVLARAPRLRVIANYAVGYDNIDLAAATARGIAVANTPGVLTEATADFAFTLLLAAARRLGDGERLIRAGHWQGFAPDLLLGTELAGKTLGILGFGATGRAMARRARGFGMQVLAADSRGGLPAAGDGVVPVSLDQLWADSDAISLHCPLTPATRGVVSRAAIAQMRPGAILVNTARGPCLDEDAVADALERGHLGGAGLDVFTGEPAIHPRLLTAPRTVLAPHLGSATTTARVRMAELCMTAVRDVLAGRRPANLVAPRPAPAGGAP